MIADPATVYDDNRDNDLSKIKRLKQLFSNPKLLDPNERAILCSRLGLDRGEPQSLEMLGQRFGVTRERIRQIQHMCLRRLRRYMMQSDNEFVEFLENCSEVSSTPRRKKLVDKTPPQSRSGWLYEAPQGKKRAPKWSALSKAQVPSGIKRRTRARASSASAIEKQKGKVQRVSARPAHFCSIQSHATNAIAISGDKDKSDCRFVHIMNASRRLCENTLRGVSGKGTVSFR